MTNAVTTPRKVPIAFMVDTNCVNSRQRIDAMNQLEAWAEAEVINRLVTAQVAQNEMLVGADALRKEKAYSFMFTESEREPEDQAFLDQFGALVFPRGVVTRRQEHDVELVFNAFKYRRVLITTDGESKSQPGGILGARQKLAPFGITVVRPEEAVAMVREAILRRDEALELAALSTGQPLPEWAGKD